MRYEAIFKHREREKGQERKKRNNSTSTVRSQTLSQLHSLLITISIRYTMVVTYTSSTISPTQPRRSERERTATARFAESWFSAKLRSLSLALGLGVADINDHVKVVREASSSDADDSGAIGLQEAEDEMCVLHVMEVQEADVVAEAVPELRRSQRERRATERFVEGWFGVRLPALSSALGLSGAGGKPV